jgi:hypothetical protein
MVSGDHAWYQQFSETCVKCASVRDTPTLDPHNDPGLRGGRVVSGVWWWRIAWYQARFRTVSGAFSRVGNHFEKALIQAWYQQFSETCVKCANVRGDPHFGPPQWPGTPRRSCGARGMVMQDRLVPTVFRNDVSNSKCVLSVRFTAWPSL